MSKPDVTADSRWDDPAFVERFKADMAAEERGELDEGLTRDEIEARYKKYLPSA